MLKLTFIIKFFLLLFFFRLKLIQNLLYFALSLNFWLIKYWQHVLLSWAGSIFQICFKVFISSRFFFGDIQALRKGGQIIRFFLSLWLRSCALGDFYDITIFSILKKVLILLFYFS